MNSELEQIASSIDLNQIRREDDLAVLRQLPAPIYVLDTLQAIISTMARNIVSVGLDNRPEILNLVSIIYTSLMDSTWINFACGNINQHKNFLFSERTKYLFRLSRSINRFTSGMYH